MTVPPRNFKRLSYFLDQCLQLPSSTVPHNSSIGNVLGAENPNDSATDRANIGHNVVLGASGTTKVFNNNQTGAWNGHTAEKGTFLETPPPRKDLASDVFPNILEVNNNSSSDSLNPENLIDSYAESLSSSVYSDREGQGHEKKQRIVCDNEDCASGLSNKFLEMKGFGDAHGTFIHSQTSTKKTQSFYTNSKSLHKKQKIAIAHKGINKANFCSVLPLTEDIYKHPNSKIPIIRVTNAEESFLPGFPADDTDLDAIDRTIDRPLRIKSNSRNEGTTAKKDSKLLYRTVHANIENIKAHSMQRQPETQTPAVVPPRKDLLMKPIPEEDYFVSVSESQTPSQKHYRFKHFKGLRNEKTRAKLQDEGNETGSDFSFERKPSIIKVKEKEPYKFIPNPPIVIYSKDLKPQISKSKPKKRIIERVWFAKKQF